MAKIGIAIFKSCLKHGYETKPAVDIFNIGKYVLKMYSN